MKILIRMFFLVAFLVTAMLASIAYTEGMEEIFKARLRGFIGEEELKELKYRKTEIEGIYEVRIRNSVIYMTRNGYVFVGVLLDPGNRNLTLEAFNDLRREKLNESDILLGVEIGNGPNEVIEFVDPDCPHCRVVDRWLENRPDVTRRVFYYPLSDDPEKERKILYIICSRDSKEHHRQIMRGEWDTKKPDVSPYAKTACGALLEKHKSFGRALGITGTPLLIVNRTHFIEGADLQELERILNASKASQ